MLENVYEGLNARKCIWRLKAKVYLSKEYFCKMYPTCVSSLRVYFVLIAFQKSHFFPSPDCLWNPSHRRAYGPDWLQTCEGEEHVYVKIYDIYVNVWHVSWLDHNLLRQLLRYVNAWDHLILGIEIVFFCFIFYYIIEEILEIVHTGWGVICLGTHHLSHKGDISAHWRSILGFHIHIQYSVSVSNCVYVIF